LKGLSEARAVPIADVFWLSPATAAKMNQLGIFTAIDLKAKDKSFLKKHFGKAGPHFYSICRGIDLRPVRADPQIDRC
jgi:DNA polymerase IV